MPRTARAVFFLISVLTLSPAGAMAQGTIADYQRAMALREAYQNLAVGVPDAPTWIARIASGSVDR